MGSVIGVIKGDTRSSDYSSHRTADAKEAHIQIVVPKVHSIDSNKLDNMSYTLSSCSLPTCAA